MTSKLKCPFCGEEIVSIPNIAQTRTVGFRCYNIQCKAFNHFMPVFILEALIQAKQDLEITRTALKDARIFANTHCIATAVKTIDKALEQIEHKEEE